jgi:hypothetical protein
LFSYRIAYGEAIDTAEPYARRQFGIKHLLTITFLVAFLVGVLRFAATANSPPSSTARDVLLTGLFFAMLLPPLIIPWATLAYRPDRKRRTLVALAACVLASVGCIATLSTMHDLMVGFPLQLVAMSQLGAVLGGFISAFVLLLCGYRIFSMRKLPV